jgi:hypothetical protein
LRRNIFAVAAWIKFPSAGIRAGLAIVEALSMGWMFIGPVFGSSLGIATNAQLPIQFDRQKIRRGPPACSF